MFYKRLTFNCICFVRGGSGRPRLRSRKNKSNLSFLPRFSGLDVLIQGTVTTTKYTFEPYFCSTGARKHDACKLLEISQRVDENGCMEKQLKFLFRPTMERFSCLDIFYCLHYKYLVMCPLQCHKFAAYFHSMIQTA